jgi:glycosyltransferase involved in cell wall biosynthesis
MNQTNGPSVHLPLVSIGVPVFNGERFLERALDSLLDQTFPDFELIISDNASNDATQAICEAYVRRDRRVRYIRQISNIGAPRNWNVLVHEARGIFFKWASANDYCSPRMLQECVKVMKADPGVVLCYGRTQLVDENDQPLEVYEGDISFDEDRPSERFASVYAQLKLNNAQCGMFRLDVLRLTRLDRLYPSGDKALIAEIALYGRLKVIPEVLLFRCQSRRTFTSMLTPVEQQKVYDPEAKAPMKFILGRRSLDNLVSISRAPISVMEKIRAYRIALRIARWNRINLWREFLSVLKGASSSV